MTNIKFENEKNSWTEFTCDGTPGFLFFYGDEANIESPADPFFSIPTKAMSLEELKEDDAAYEKTMECIEAFAAMARV